MAEQRSERAAGQIEQLIAELTLARQQAERWQAQAAEHRAELASARSELTAALAALDAERTHGTQRLTDQRDRYEELISELKQDYTIVIVTHNMQQAARVSDYTAFFNLEAVGKPGRLVEVDDTEKIFSNPTQKATEDYISGRFG